MSRFILPGGGSLFNASISLGELFQSVTHYLHQLPFQELLGALIPALRQSLLDYLTQEGTLSAKATFVLNNVFAREILKRRDIEAALGTRITTDLPYDPFLYLKAVNEGVPIVIGAPRSPAAEQLAKLSVHVFGEDVLEVAANQPRKGGRFGLRRRS